MMVFVLIFIIFLLIIALIVEKNLSDKKYNILKEDNEYIKKRFMIKNNEYLKKRFMTKNEEYFYNIFKEIANENNLIIHPQVNLATIIEKKNSKYRNELFRNIDFAFFSTDYRKLLLLIEINDSSHLNSSRKQRDKKVKNICDAADIKLITFYIDKPNEKNYVKNRILKNLYIDTLD